MSNYMKKYGFLAWPLYEYGGGGGGGASRDYHEKITVYLLMRSAFT